MNQPSTPAARIADGLERQGRARVAALLAAVLFSTGGVVLKAGAFNSLQLSGFRSALAVAALAIWARGRIRVSPAILAAAVAYAATLTLFVSATRLTTAAAAIFLQSTAPLFLAVLGPLWLHEALRREDRFPLALVLAGLTGCLFGYPPATATAPNPVLGNILGMTSGLTWACTLAGLRAATVRHGSSAAVSAIVLGNGIAAVAALPFAFPLPLSLTSADLLVLVYLGLVQVALAYVLLSVAVRHLPALDVSLLLLIEPVLNPVWTWWFRGEAPGAWVIAGGACIVLAAGVRALRPGGPVPP